MDAKKVATDGLKSVSKRFLQDLNAIPEDAFAKCFTPQARSVADIVYEVKLVNEDIGKEMRGEKPAEWPDDGFVRAPENFRTKETVMGAFEKSTAEIIAMAEGYSSEEFEEPIQTCNGETTRFERCRFMNLHMWYHSGQLNFIQTLLGDDQLHWK